MKITFFSNFLNHHQIPFSNELFKLFHNDYTFVSTEKMYDEQVKLGYQTDFSSYPYLLEAFKSDKDYYKALELGLNSDVVIIGSASEEFIEERIKKNKLTFRYSERIFKTNKNVLTYPKIFLKRFKRDTVLRNKNIYMLSASAFNPVDFSMFFSYPRKFLKWGYFPPTNIYEVDYLARLKQSSDFIEVVWVGRMIPYKRPLDALQIIDVLVQKGHKCHLTMVGTGKLLSQLKNYVESRNLKANVTFTGAIKSAQVRSYMERAKICLVTSNKEEGWGAVINEAMNSGCAVYAYYRIGAAPYLIQQNNNGVLYRNKSDVIKKLSSDITDTDKLRRMGEKAYQTIQESWNAEIAAKNFVLVVSQMLSGNQKIVFPKVGPMSKAPLITKFNVFRNLGKERE